MDIDGHWIRLTKKERGVQEVGLVGVHCHVWVCGVPVDQCGFFINNPLRTEM